ncbi:NADPH:quinone oxidoreductase family protein [Sneathiella litorea]|uniref:Zinc-binding dehydrogenase n=1 Tax=Sneathiella litorea TaxID=2606216 RepID=A0A6L8W6I5_9PROT|nr:NADPH:quinone oxidoreductase family protein [Sneathiella litorea]MZR30678.1 zinc-binding dehydrogenase [Sneathiella litorea]
MMRGILCDSYGWPRSLELRDIPEPQLRPGQLLVEVQAAGVNFADTLVMSGEYQEKLDLPFIPGAELCGTVIEVADDVSGFMVGDRIICQVPSGAYAEIAAVDARTAIKIPKSMSAEEAAGFYIAYGTAYCGLLHRGRFQKGESVLITGAAGGVGRAAVDLAVALGANVIAVAGGVSRQEDLLRLGASAVFDSDPSQLRQKIMEATDGKGIDIVLDMVGGGVTRESLRCLKFEGRLLLIGFATGSAASLPSNHLLVKNVDVCGFYWGPYQSRFPLETRESFEQLFAFYEQGRLHPKPGLVLPINKINEAYVALNKRKHSGKIILEIKK